MKQAGAKKDAELITSYLSGDQKAIKYLIEKWHLKLCDSAYWIVKDADLAKDIAQETWQIVLAKLSELQNREKFGWWILRIVHNKSIDALNKQNRERLTLKDYNYKQLQDCLQSHDNIEIKKQLQNTLQKLNTNQKQVLTLFYIESYSLNQIADLLDISVGTAKSRLFYAREHLKSLLKNRHYEN